MFFLVSTTLRERTALRSHLCCRQYGVLSVRRPSLRRRSKLSHQLDPSDPVLPRPIIIVGRDDRRGRKTARSRSETPEFGTETRKQSDFRTWSPLAPIVIDLDTQNLKRRVLSMTTMSSPSSVDNDPAYDRAVRTLHEFHRRQHCFRFGLEAIDESSEHHDMASRRRSSSHELHKAPTCSSLSALYAATELESSSLRQRPPKPPLPLHSVRHSSSPQLRPRMKRFGEESTANASWGLYQEVDSGATPSNIFLSAAPKKQPPIAPSAFAKPTGRPGPTRREVPPPKHHTLHRQSNNNNTSSNPTAKATVTTSDQQI